MVDFSESGIDISWYKPIFQNAQESITITDIKGNIILANDPALELLEYTPQELQEMNISDLYVNEDDRLTMLSNLKEKGMLKNYAIRLVSKSGKVKDLSVNLNPIYDAIGEIVAIHSNFIDKSSILQTRLSLKESEERYRTLVEHAPEAITVLDVEAMKFFNVNMKAQEFFKMSQEELLTKSPLELSPVYLPSGDRSEIVAMKRIEEAVNGGNPIFDWIHINADGKHIPCQVQLIRLPHSERILVRGSIIDMSDKIEAEQKLNKSQLELAQAQKMEALGRLAGGVAHDFNNTLTAILGFCELLRFQYGDLTDLVDMVSQIEKAGTKSTQLVKQLLTFSRKEEPQSQPIDLNIIIKETSNLLHHLIGADIRIETILDPSIGLVEAHPQHISQILMNLVINAREAMPNGGLLTIRTYDYILMNEDGEMKRSVFLYVSDTGIGMDEEILDQIFEPFFTTKSTGTGLGLSTVYGIVEQLNGNIKVDSKPNEGTTFQVCFPTTDQEVLDEPIVQKMQDRSLLEGKYVLIVEDDDQVRVLVDKVLNEFNMKVTSIKSPPKAIEVLKTTPIDIVISDMIMPEMSGIDMITEIKPHFETLRVLFVTGYMNQPQLQRVLENGYPVLYKPFTRDNLLNMITQIFIDNP